MPTCTKCGAHVTKTYARVLGDENGELAGCPDCSGLGERERRR